VLLPKDFVQNLAGMLLPRLKPKSNIGKYADQSSMLMVMSLQLVAGAKSQEPMNTDKVATMRFTLSAPLRLGEPGTESRQSKDRG
jgi:hypothetical protein